MAKLELGTKWVCVACRTRFYDLTKFPAVCPKCRTAQPPPGHARANIMTEKRLKKQAPAPADLDVEIEDVEDVEEEEIPDAADDLQENTDVISEDVQVETHRNER